MVIAKINSTLSQPTQQRVGRGKSYPNNRSRALITAIGLLLWAIAAVLILLKVVFEPDAHSVVDSYLLGAQRWQERVALYSGPGGFIYMPTFAVLFLPFFKLPLLWAELCWRLLLLVCYGSAIHQLTTLLNDRLPKAAYTPGYSRGYLFSLLSLIALPIAFSGLRNGQLNILLISVMVWVTCWLIQARWYRAAACLALIMSIKPTFIVFFLLTTVLYRPLWWRVPIFLVGFLMFPILLAGIAYGGQQYHHFIAMSRDAMALGMREPNWATLFNVLPQIAGWSVSEAIQVIIKTVLAGLTWLMCWVSFRRFDYKTSAVYLLTLASCYHVLFNPRSVNTDYVILGTVMALWFVAAYAVWHRSRLALGIAVNAIVVLLAYELSVLFTPAHTSWVNPLAGLVFTITVLGQWAKGRTFSTGNSV